MKELFKKITCFFLGHKWSSSMTYCWAEEGEVKIVELEGFRECIRCHSYTRIINL